MLEFILILLFIMFIIAGIFYFSWSMADQDERYYKYINDKIYRERDLERRVFFEIE